MGDFHAVSGLVQALADFLGDHHGAVLAAGAAKADGEIAFAFMDIVRQQVNKKIGNAADEFFGLGKRADVFGHARIAACEWTEFGNEVRVGKKANVKNQVGFFRHTVTKTEAHARNQNAFSGSMLAEALGNVGA